MTTYTCTLSGAVEEGVDMSFSHAVADALLDAPEGWTKITVQRRVVNNQWRLIQLAKTAMLQDLERGLRDAGLTGDALELRVAIGGQQAEAYWFALEKATPPYLIEEEVVWVANSADALEPFNEVREILDLPPMERLLEEDEEVSVGEDGSTPS